MWFPSAASVGTILRGSRVRPPGRDHAAGLSKGSVAQCRGDTAARRTDSRRQFAELPLADGLLCLVHAVHDVSYLAHDVRADERDDSDDRQEHHREQHKAGVAGCGVCGRRCSCTRVQRWLRLRRHWERFPPTGLSELPRREGPRFPIEGLSGRSDRYDGPSRGYSPSAVSLGIGSHAHT